MDGKVRKLTETFDSQDSSATAVGEFVSKLAASGTEWFTEGGAEDAFGSWLSQHVGDIINGDMDGDEALISLGQYMAGSFLSNFVVNDVLTANAAIHAVLRDEFHVEDDILYDDGNGQLLTRAEMYAGSIAAGLTQMVATFVTSGFDEDQALNAGLSITAGKLAASYLRTHGLMGPGYAGDVTVAIATVVQSFVSGNFDGDWGQLGIQVGAAVAMFEAAQLLAPGVASLTGLSTTALPIIGVDPATLVASLIIAALAPSITKALFGSGKKFGMGEFDSIQKTLNSVYQIQTVVIDGVSQQALVAVNPLGSTIIGTTATLGYILGNSGSDVLVGNDAIQTMVGNAGSDYLEGRMGDDNLLGGDGNDHLNGGEGNDMLQGDAGDDLMFGEADDDTIIAGAGDDFVHGGTGDDVISGGDGRDYILAAGDDDAVSGDAGDDVIDGGYGNDSLLGGAGNDLILGNYGNDHIEGEEGDDTIFGDDGNDQVYGGSGNDFIEGGAGNDILQGDNGDDLISAGDDDDYAEGGLGDDSILGGSGSDVLLGGMDDDYLAGETGDDSLSGGFGNDIMVGGVGENTLDGGEGNDVFVIGADTLEADNIISDADGDDVVLLDWMSDTQANADLELLQDGDDLQISYDGRVLATITDQFVTGHEIETIELANGKYINLASVSYDSTTHLGTFTTDTLSSGSVAGLPTQHQQQIEESFLTQDGFFNSAFLDTLSMTAYNELLANETGYAYYDGTQIIAEKRSRGGLFGGHYTVYKLNQPGSFNGTDTSQHGYAVLDPEDQASAAPYLNDTSTLLPQVGDTIITGATIHYSTVGVYQFQDIIVGGTVVSTKLQGSPTQYSAGATINGVTYAARMATGTNTTSDVAVKNFGNDLLIGAYWDETIDGKSGDDVIVGNTGNDSLIGGTGDDWLFGGDGNDTLNGDDGNEMLFGGDGNDSITGGNGNDVVLGGGGTDTIYSEAGDDWIEGGAGSDYIDAGSGNDIIFGGDGNNTLRGGADNDVLHGGGMGDMLYGGSGNDTLYSGSGFDTLLGGDGIDLIPGDEYDRVNYIDSTAAVSINLSTNVNTGGTAQGDILYNIEEIYASAYNDTLVGAAANESFIGAGGNDSIAAGGGNDSIYGADMTYGAAGADTMDGGAGIDLVSYEYATAAVTVNMATNSNSGQAAGDVISNIENLDGSGYADNLTGDAAANYIRGLAGVDTITGGAGNDTLNGGAGADVLNGGADSDWVSYQNSASGVNIDFSLATQVGGEAQGDSYTSIENIIGSAYADIFTGNSAANAMDGVAGFDRVYYRDSTVGVNVNLATNVNTGGTAQGDLLYNIEEIYASIYNDTLTGSAAAESFIGANGNDLIAAGGGNDSIYGADMTYGAAGADTMDGGAGIDLVSYEYATAAVTVNMATNSNSGQAAGDVISNIENLDGSGYADNLTGDAGDNLIRGLAGTDTISGGAGNDTIEGGAGADTIDGGADTDAVRYLSSTAAVNINLTLSTAQSGGDAAGDILSNIENVYGSSYNDTITGNAGNNHLWGGAGNDSLTGGDGADTMEGEAGNDAIFGGLGVDSLLGGEGNDTVYGEDGNDSVFGGAGDDLLRGNAGADLIDGGSGNDWASYYTSAAGVAVDLNLSTAQSGGDAAGDTITGIEWVYGSLYDDTLTGDSNNNNLGGDNGNDSIKGGAGADTLDGGAGTDWVIYSNSLAVTVNLALTTAQSGGDAAGDILTNFENLLGSSFGDVITGTSGNNILDGGDGDDIINGGSGADTIYGGNGNDHFIGGAGADVMNGGADRDLVDYTASTSAINVNLLTNVATGGDAAGDTFSGIDIIYGTNYNDTITAGTPGVMMSGIDGLYMMGFGGNDVLTGGSGTDALEGGAGADTLDGGAGNDYVSYEYSSAAVNVNLSLSTAQSGGDAAGDILMNLEYLYGSAYNDTLTGTNGANFLRGWTGNDTILGGDGNDTIEGNDGDDSITGGNGNDIIYGGAGNDIFVYNSTSFGVDTIYDFTDAGVAGGDVIQISAATGFTSYASLSGNISVVSGNTLINFGSGNTITVVGVTNLASGDFSFV